MSFIKNLLAFKKNLLYFYNRTVSFNREAKINTLRKLQSYMGRRKVFLTGSLTLSGLSTILGMMPFIFIWLLIRVLFDNPGKVPVELVNKYAWWALGTAVGGVVIYFLALMLSHLAAFRVETNMRRRAMEKLMAMPLGFFDSNTSGRMRKIIDDNAGITHSFLAHQLPDLAGNSLMPLVSLILIFFFDWRFGLACLIPLVFAMALMSTMMGKKGRHFMKMYMDSLEEMNTEAVEYVRGIPVVKVFQQTVFSFKSFYNSISRYREMVCKYTLLWEKPMASYTVIVHGFVYLLIPVALILMKGSNKVGLVLLNLFFYILITPVFGQSIMKSMYMNQALGHAAEAVNRVEKLTDAEPLREPENPEPVKGAEIGFKNVTFTYPGSKTPALKEVSFTVPEGKIYALVGPSGGGKTTIAGLVPRFRDTESGEVTLGGTDVRNIATEELMSNISFVFQNTKLFRASIEENIKYGNPDATDEDVEKAIDLAQCREIVDKLPDGIRTVIGEEGVWLSGGEQQRVALARAFLKDAPVIVLDEATAFADPENEHLIQEAIRKLMSGKTVLMIAHRLSSVVDVDSILVINEGRIEEQGTHKKLADSEGLYSRMWKEYRQSVKWTIGKEG